MNAIDLPDLFRREPELCKVKRGGSNAQRGSTLIRNQEPRPYPVAIARGGTRDVLRTVGENMSGGP
ncbi:MAG TPA: hypothetical protein VMB81_32265 [Candidatus Sulfotelmatobacter sp.]|nr:hypothetical protein [Candidatus Sulfotelmatobacter sp.]